MVAARRSGGSPSTGSLGPTSHTTSTRQEQLLRRTRHHQRKMTANDRSIRSLFLTSLIVLAFVMFLVQHSNKQLVTSLSRSYQQQESARYKEDLLRQVNENYGRIDSRLEELKHLSAQLELRRQELPSLQRLQESKEQLHVAQDQRYAQTHYDESRGANQRVNDKITGKRSEAPSENVATDRAHSQSSPSNNVKSEGDPSTGHSRADETVHTMGKQTVTEVHSPMTIDIRTSARSDHDMTMVASSQTVPMQLAEKHSTTNALSPEIKTTEATETNSRVSEKTAQSAHVVQDAEVLQFNGNDFMDAVNGSSDHGTHTNAAHHREQMRIEAAAADSRENGSSEKKERVVQNKGDLPSKCYALSNDGAAYSFEYERDFREDSWPLQGLSVLFIGDSNDNWLVKELHAEECGGKEIVGRMHMQSIDRKVTQDWSPKPLKTDKQQHQAQMHANASMTACATTWRAPKKLLGITTNNLKLYGCDNASPRPLCRNPPADCVVYPGMCIEVSGYTYQRMSLSVW
mmetsp:Transcript_9607/g.35209  ORF Transcript_9607/g.35209 Transcript_9607/m.35209 type:complete len:516 (+) Transcript_9607:237-1784(+)